MLPVTLSVTFAASTTQLRDQTQEATHSSRMLITHRNCIPKSRRAFQISIASLRGVSFKYLFSTSCFKCAPELQEHQKKNTVSTSASSLKNKNISFRNDFVMFAGYLSHRINSIKHEWDTLHGEPTPKFLANLKHIIETIGTDMPDYYRFINTIDRIRPIIQTTLKKLDTAQFIDFVTFLSSYGIPLESEVIAEKILDMKDLPLDDLYKLASTEGMTDSPDLFAPLTSKQKQRIRMSYPPNLIEWIVYQVYFPLSSKHKIDEFIGILYQLRNDEETANFERAINVLMGREQLEIRLRCFEKVELALKAIYNHQRLNFKQMGNMTLLMSERYVHKMLQACDITTIFRYLNLVFSPLPKQLKSFHMLGTKEVSPLLLNKVDEIVMHDVKVPSAILSMLFRKFLEDADLEQIKSLINEVQSLDLSDEFNQRIECCCRLTLMKYADEIREKKKECCLYIVQSFKDSEYTFPGEYLDILKPFEAYKTRFDGFLQFLEFQGMSGFGYKKIKSAELDYLFAHMEEYQRNAIIKTLIKGNYTFDNRDHILSWIAQNPHRVNYVISGGVVDLAVGYNHKTKRSMARACTIFTPLEILKLASKYGENLAATSDVLTLLMAYKDTHVDHIIARLNSFRLPEGTAESHFLSLTTFMEKHERIIENITEDERLQLLNTFIKKTLEVNCYSGVVVACSLVPSYKKTLLPLFKLSLPSALDTSSIEHIIYHSDAEVSLEIIKSIISAFERQNSIPHKMWCTHFKNLAEYSTTLKDPAERENFKEFLLKAIQTLIIRKNLSPFILYKIYSMADSFQFNPDWKLKFNSVSYIENYIRSEPFISAEEIKYIIGAVSTFECNLQFSRKFYSTVFDAMPEEGKIPILFSLRNMSTRFPYEEKIARFISDRVEAEDPDIYKLFGLQMSNLSSTASHSWRIKWSKMDVRYLTPFIAKYMKRVIDKDCNLALRYVMTDSMASMPYNDEFDACYRFYQNFLKSTRFDANPEVTRSTNLQQLVKEYMTNYADANNIPNELLNPYVYHFLYTRLHSYDTKTLIEMLYIITRGDGTLEQLGFWGLLRDEDKVRLELTEISGRKFYAEMTDDQLTNLFILISATCKMNEKVSNNELLCVVNIAESLIDYELLSDKNKTLIMNCVFLIVNKHSDIITAFFRKMLLKFPDYKATFPIARDLLYSTIVWDSNNLDSMMDYMNNSYNQLLGNQICEAVIRRLIDEQQNALAQDLYLRCCEQRPKFKMPDVNEKMNWSVAKRPAVVIDSNEGVNMKMDRFKVKLYDYDNLDKEKK